MFHRMGPLINPGQPQRMIVGVSNHELGPLMLQTLLKLGVEKAWVVHGDIGVDEVVLIHN